MPTKDELCRAEDAAWIALRAVLDTVPARFYEEIGYTEEWSVKDLLAHVGAWQAEAVQVLERIRMGTFVVERLDIDAMNREFVEASRPLPLPAVRAEAAAARTRMLQEFDALAEITADAQEWFVECGAAHYEEHVDRLRAWGEELRSRA
jgi:hypothetical protein